MYAFLLAPLVARMPLFLIACVSVSLTARVLAFDPQ